MTLLTLPAAARPSAPGAGSEPSVEVAAVWREHRLDFGYQGMTTNYSCQGLAAKVESLLSFFGAREKTMKVSPYGCAAAPYTPVRAVNLKLAFETLAPAGTAAHPIPATWVERDLRADQKVQRAAPQRITRGDCELVQSFVAQVLPAFTHETVRDLTSCVPHHLSGSAPKLSVKVLWPEPAPEP